MANNEIKASVVVSLDDKNVTQGARNIAKSTENMTKNMIRSTNKVNAQYRGLSMNLNSTASQLKKFGTDAMMMYGGAQAFRKTWEYNDAVRELGNKLKKTKEEMDVYKDQVFAIQLLYGTSKDVMNSYANEIASSSKSMEEFVEKLKLAAIANKGLNLDAETLKNYSWLVKEFKVLDEMGFQNRVANIADKGRFNASELIESAHQVMPNWSGKKDQNALYEIMSYIQSMGGDTQNASEATANFNALLNDLGDDNMRLFLKKRLGFDPLEMKDGNLELKNLQAIVDAMAEDTKNGRYKDGLWYDQKGVLQARISEGGAKTTQLLANKSEDISLIKNGQGVSAEQMAYEQSKNFSSSMEKLMSVLERFADMNLSGPIDDLSRAIANLDPEDVQEFLNILKEVGKYAGTAYLAFKTYTATKGGIDLVKGAFGKATEIQKVYVTNMNEINKTGGGKNLGVKGAGALALLSNMQFVLENADTEIEKTDALRGEYGDENIKRWMNEQGYSFMSMASMLGAKEMQALIVKGQLTDQYDIKKVNALNNANDKWYKPSVNIKDIDVEALNKILEDNANQLSKPIEIKPILVNGEVMVDSKIVVDVRTPEGLIAKIQSKVIESKGILNTPEKLGNTGGGQP